MPLCVITDYMGDDTTLEERLLSGAGIQVFVSPSPHPASWIAAAEKAEAILTRHAPIRRESIDRFEACRIIARYGTGYDNIDLATALDRDIVVTSVPDFCTQEVAEHTLAFILLHARQLRELTEVLRAGGWQLPSLPPIDRLAGKQLAILGCGRIGSAVADRALAFGMKVKAFDPQASSVPAGVEMVSTVEDLVVSADVLSLHAPLLRSTRGIIGRPEIMAMNQGALLINVARGGLLDLEAATDALESGHLSGLALDVYEREPPPPDHRLRKMPGAILTPHVAYYSSVSVEEAKRRSASEVIAVLRGDRPTHPLTRRNLET